MRIKCENCDGLGHTDSGTTICPSCLDTGVVTPQLTAAIAALSRYFTSSEANAVVKNYEDAQTRIAFFENNHIARAEKSDAMLRDWQNQAETNGEGLGDEAEFGFYGGKFEGGIEILNVFMGKCDAYQSREPVAWQVRAGKGSVGGLVVDKAHQSWGDVIKSDDAEQRAKWYAEYWQGEYRPLYAGHTKRCEHSPSPDKLCTKCHGNGVIRLPNGVEECNRCHGIGWWPR